MARLILATPEGQQVVELRDHNSLGRHPSNSIQLLDKIVSKEHCLVIRHGPDFVLRDLGSLNGTYINGERVVGEQKLNHADDISLGSTRARYDDGSGPPLAAPTDEKPPERPAWQRGAGGGNIRRSRHTAGTPSARPRAPPLHPRATRHPSRNRSHRKSARRNPPPGHPMSAQGVQPERPTGPTTTAALSTAALQGLQNVGGTRVDVNDASRAIGTQIKADQRGFLPYDEVAANPAQLAADYERLRLSHELSREIGLERELSGMLNKILMSVFRFVRADRGVIFLRDTTGELHPAASLRRDGTDAPITVSTTIMNHVMKERATVPHPRCGDGLRRVQGKEHDSQPNQLRHRRAASAR